VSQAYAKDRLWREIENRNGRKVLMFTAGGVAAGKSTAVTDEQVAAKDLVFDGTLRESDWAIQTIERALERGWRVEINYVQRPLDLVIPGAIKRANDGGRWGALADLPAIHQAAQQSTIEIAKHFAGNPAVKVNLWLNEGKTTAEKPKLLALEQIDVGGEYSYDENYEQSLDRTGNQREPGTVSESIRSRRTEEVRRLFTEAVRSGRYEPRVLGLLAEGNADLGQILRRELGGKGQSGAGTPLHGSGGIDSAASRGQMGSSGSNPHSQDTANDKPSSGQEPAQDAELAQEKPEVKGGASYNQTDLMDRWDDNPGGLMRSVDEAKEIFRKHIKAVEKNFEGLDLLPQVTIRVMPSGSMRDRWAQYEPRGRTGIKGEYKWKDFFDRRNRIVIEIDERVMTSDQAIVGIIAHELYELNAIRQIIESNQNKSIPEVALQKAINDFHTSAVRLQNRSVQYLKRNKH